MNNEIRKLQSIRKLGGNPSTTLCFFDRKGNPCTKQGCKYQHPSSEESYSGLDLRAVISSKQNDDKRFEIKCNDNKNEEKEKISQLEKENNNLRKELKDLKKKYQDNLESQNTILLDVLNELTKIQKKYRILNIDN